MTPDPRLRELHVRLVSARRALDSLRRDLEAASELLHAIEEDAEDEGLLPCPPSAP